MATSTIMSSVSDPNDVLAKVDMSDPRASATAADAAVRRAKKREQDRRSQRMARERTKHRLAYLEGMVTELKEQNVTKQIQAIWKERDDIAAERDALARTLRTIERAVQTTKKLTSTTGKVSQPVDLSSTSNSLPDDLRIQSPMETISSTIENACLDTSQPDIIWPTSNDSVNNAGLSSKSDFSWPHERTAFCNNNSDSIVPCSTGSCECTPPPEASAPVKKELNLWRFANETLTETSNWSALISANEEALKDDIPIRAMIEGWDSAEHRAGGTLPPSWRKLRRIDETLFFTCAKTERLAILRVMQSLFLYHQEASTERRAELPDWYLARPSQNLAHSYAIDYFAWPGLRERFVFHQHQYCSNKFWKLFASDLRILWPFEFRDCYTRNTYTGEYKMSTSFHERIKDIRAWTMSTGIFQAWPEFLCDIPVFDSVPPSLSAGTFPRRLSSTKGNRPLALMAAPDASLVRHDSETNDQTHDTGRNNQISKIVDDLATALVEENYAQSYNDLSDLMFFDTVAE